MRARVFAVTTTLVVVSLTTTAYFGCKTPGGNQAALKDAIADTPDFLATKLEMSADSQTGDVFVAFDASQAGVAPGATVEIVWDVLRSNRDVNCSELRKRLELTVPAGGGRVDAEFNVDPKVLADSLDSSGTADNDKETKYGHAGKGAFHGETVVEGCLKVPGRGFIAAGAAMPDPKATAGNAKKKRGAGLNLADDDSDLPVGLRYGERCAKAIGYIKPFSCIGDGVTVPITVDGQLQDRFVDQCDKPQYLPIGPTQCATNTRVGRLKLYTDKNYTQERTDGKVVYFCRHYEDAAAFTVGGNPATSGPNYPYFHDVAVIMQNTDTGKTCFFQALGGGRPNGQEGEDLFGLRVPPPTETFEEFATKVDAATRQIGAQPAWKTDVAGGFWLSPGNIGQIHCISCHDSDPFMHSPWIDQVKVADAAGNATDELMVPSEPSAAYKVIGAGIQSFNDWDTAYAVKTADAKCMSCHRIGSMAAIRTWAKDAFPMHSDGVAAANGDYYDLDSKGPWALSHPNHHWMPPPTGDASWVNDIGRYKKSAQQLRDCLDVRRADGTRILGYGRINRASRTRLNQSDTDVLASKGCTVTRISEVVDR